MAKKKPDFKKTAREKWRAEGMIPKEIWVFPEDWPEILAFINFKKTERRKQKSS
jgi:hypothetical protein